VRVTVGVASGKQQTPYAVVIAPSGAVRTLGYPPAQAYPVPSENMEKLADRVRTTFPKLKSKNCPGAFSNRSSARFITALGRTVKVRGACDQRFTNLWDFLTNSVGIFQLGL
jgi:hypothetical protein